MTVDNQATIVAFIRKNYHFIAEFREFFSPESLTPTSPLTLFNEYKADLKSVRKGLYTGFDSLN